MKQILIQLKNQQKLSNNHFQVLLMSFLIFIKIITSKRTRTNENYIEKNNLNHLFHFNSRNLEIPSVQIENIEFIVKSLLEKYFSISNHLIVRKVSK